MQVNQTKATIRNQTNKVNKKTNKNVVKVEEVDEDQEEVDEEVDKEVEDEVEDEVDDDDQEVEEEVEEEVEDDVEKEVEDEDQEEDQEDTDKSTKQKQKKSKNIHICEDIHADLQRLEEIENDMEKLSKERKAIYRGLSKEIKNRDKKKKHKRSNEPSKNKSRNGLTDQFTTPQKFKIFYEQCLRPDENFSIEFSNFDINNVSRTELTKMIHFYIRSKNLYNQKADGSYDKMSINPDECLKNLFSISDGDILFDYIIKETDLKESKRNDPKEREKIGTKSGIRFANFQKYITRLCMSDTIGVQTVNEDNEEI